MRFPRSPRSVGLICILTMAASIAAVAQLEHYLIAGGTREKAAGIMEEAALFCLFLGAGTLILIAFYVAWRETAVQCLHYAFGVFILFAATLGITLLAGFSVHSWKASLIVPATSLGLAFLILLGTAGWRSLRQQ